MQDRLIFLFSGPVLSTLEGARGRLAVLNLADLFLLTRYFDCEIDKVHRKLWEQARKGKR